MSTEYKFTAEEYDKLYRRFISDARTTDLVKSIKCKGKVVLDLCAGSGRLSKKAIALGAQGVIALDMNRNVINISNANENIVPVVSSVQSISSFTTFKWMSGFLGEPSVVYCQQAINYWFDTINIGNLFRNFVNKDVSFAFNTFNKKPSGIPTSKTYEIDGLTYNETWYLVKECGDEMIYHVQSCEGMQPHLTSFKWISENGYFDVLRFYFKEVKKTDYGNSTIWVASGIK